MSGSQIKPPALPEVHDLTAAFTRLSRRTAEICYVSSYHRNREVQLRGEEHRMRFGTFSYNQARPRVPERQAFEELLEQI